MQKQPPVYLHSILILFWNRIESRLAVDVGLYFFTQNESFSVSYLGKEAYDCLSFFISESVNFYRLA